ncbi:hypothetical protein [Novosphingobium aquimarinum]|uniref:hypothetical protein n=1 Tax=Novosphingobium aquimarinum TaxID=2682494 RepID=UPI0012EB9538|nr:hypothetical protein [Novosphingobium aquimarinum]
MTDLALSLLVLATILLGLGAAYLWRREGLRRQAVLMLVLAAVMAANVAIWAIPNEAGQSLVNSARDPVGAPD